MIYNLNRKLIFKALCHYDNTYIVSTVLLIVYWVYVNVNNTKKINKEVYYIY